MTFNSKPLFVLPLLAFAAPAASAADFVEPAPVEVSQINYMSIEGGYIWTDHGIAESGDDKFGDIDDDNGFYAAATYRRMFNPNWDVQITGTATWLDEISSDTDINSMDADLDYQTGDLDVGYHPGGNPLTRLLFGVRLLHSENSLDYRTDVPFLTERSFEAEGWAIGPRVGFQSETPLGDSRFGFVAEASGSVLFGQFDIDRFSDDDGDSSSEDSRTLYNLEGLAGLAFHATDSLTITAGYRAQKWWGLREGTSVSAERYTLSSDEDVLVHGPFARVGLTF